MRWIPVFAALLAAACGDGGWPDGTYLLVDGAEAQIEFDSVEVLFGKPHGAELPEYLPSGYHADKDERQVLLKRVAAAASGTQAVPTGQQIDLYIPSDVNELYGVGSYVVVIASRNGMPVGIGELAEDGQMVLRGLPVGRHTVVTYHRSVHDADLSRFDVYVDGAVKAKGVRPTRRVTDEYDAASAAFAPDFSPKQMRLHPLGVPHTACTSAGTAASTPGWPTRKSCRETSAAVASGNVVAPSGFAAIRRIATSTGSASSATYGTASIATLPFRAVPSS
jgi:hypothetical protein